MSQTTFPPISGIAVPYVQSGPNSWMTYMFGGVMSPGTIPVGGIKGFRRETGWDIKKGKGTRGATLTLKDMPPCEGSILSQLFTEQDIGYWDDFVAAILSIPVTQQQADGIAIYHPSFVAIQLTAVVVKHFLPIEYMGKGMYHAGVELIEWHQPPPVSIVKTVSAVKPDLPGGDAPPQQSPRNAQRFAQIAATEAAAAAAEPNQ
jgi:hypothetical protein